MKRKRGQPEKTSWLFIFIATSVVIVAWILFAPQQVGGRAAYVIVNGNSMEPNYHRFDLVILQSIRKPKIGDIVAYTNPEFGPVIHRVIGIEGNQYTFKGDNNPWVDSYHPVSTELIGKAWIYIPSGGKVILMLRNPWAMTLLVIILGGVLMFGIFSKPHNEKPASRWRPGFPKISWPHPVTNRSQEIWLYILPFIFIASLILGFFSFRVPASQFFSNGVSFSHVVVYQYSASSSSNLFDNGEMRSPGPIFINMACKVDVIMSYSIASALPVKADGTYHITVRLSEYSGWSHKFELVPKTSFENGSFTKRFQLDICEIQQTAQQFVAATGAQRSVFDLVLEPEIHLNGEISGYPINETVIPQLRFELDNVQLSLAKTDNGDPLTWKQEGSVFHSDQVSNTISLLGLALPIWLTRSLSALGLIASIGGMLWLGLPLLNTMRSDEIRAIHLKYETQLVRLSSNKPLSSQHIIDVASMDDLARLAQNSGLSIFEQENVDQYQYFVITDPYIYCYTAAGKTMVQPSSDQ